MLADQQALFSKLPLVLALVLTLVLALVLLVLTLLMLSCGAMRAWKLCWC